MLGIRGLAIAGALVVAALVNVFLAPQLYSPRPPVFSGPDLAANEAWRGHAFSTQPWWLAETLPDATFIHLKFDYPPGTEDGGVMIGINFDERSLRRFEVDIDQSEFPLNLEPLNLRDEIAPHIHHFSGVRCLPSLTPTDTQICDYFVAWDRDQQDSPKVFVAVATSSVPGSEEMGLIEVTLLEKLLRQPFTSVPTIAEVSP